MVLRLSVVGNSAACQLLLHGWEKLLFPPAGRNHTQVYKDNLWSIAGGFEGADVLTQQP